MQLHTGLLDEVIRNAACRIHQDSQLLLVQSERNHDLRYYFNLRLVAFDRRFDDRPHLHLQNFRIRDGQATPAVSQHGVGFVQLRHAALHGFHGNAQFLGQFRLLGVLVRHELVQRRIDQANRNRKTIHHLKDADEVAALERQQLVQSLDAGLLLVRQDHLLNRQLPLVALLRLLEVGEEHMLGADQPNALRAEFKSLPRILRRIRICAHPQVPDLVGPLYDRVVRLRQFRRDQRHFPLVHDAFAAVQRDPVAFFQRFAALPIGHDLGLVVDVQGFRPGHAALAPAARHHGRVTRLAARSRQDALRHRHAAHIFRAGFPPHQDDLLSPCGPLFRLVRGEAHLPDGRAGHRVNPVRQYLRLQRLAVHLAVNHRIKQPLDVFRLDAQHRFFLRDQLLVGHVHCDAEGCRGRALTGARLQHVQRAFLQRELHVLHVAVVLLKCYSNPLELHVCLRHDLCQFAQVYRRAYARHDVFALCVGQIIAVENLLAGTRVACKAHARPGVVAGVPEHHLLHVHRCAQQPGDLFHPAVGDCLFRHPRSKHRANCAPQLLQRIFRKWLSGLFQVVGLVLPDQFFPAAGRHCGIFLHAQPLPHRPQLVLQVFLGHAHRHGGKHLHEAPIRVVGKTLVAGHLGDALHGFVIQAQVQDRLHHARHRARRAGTHAHQQRVVGIAELFLRHLFQPGDVVNHLLLEFRRVLLVVLVEVIAGFRRDGETRGDGQTDFGHLGQTCSLAAEQIAPFAVAFRFSCTKEIDPLFHGTLSCFSLRLLARYASHSFGIGVHNVGAPTIFIRKLPQNS